MTQDAYTGVQGAVTYAGATLAGCMFDFEITRSTVAFPRAGKWSDLNKPGKVSCKGSITRIQSNADLLMAALNGTPSTGCTDTLHAGLTAPGSGAENITDMTDTSPSSPSRIKLVATGGAVTGAGHAILYGTDAGSNKISEVVAVTTLAENSYATSKYVYTTLTHVALSEVTMGSGDTLAVVCSAGDSSVNVGAPKEFALVGAVTEGSNNITVTLSNVWFDKAPFSFEDAGKGLTEELTFVVTDPDADIAVSGADA